MHIPHIECLIFELKVFLKNDAKLRVD
jgi:hypothetical protein